MAAAAALPEKYRARALALYGKDDQRPKRQTHSQEDRSEKNVLKALCDGAPIS